MEANSLLSILLKISLIIVVVWGIWFILLRNVNRFSGVRAFIILSVLTSLISPWIFPILQTLVKLPGIATNGIISIEIPEVTITSGLSVFNWTKVLVTTYIVISSLFFIRLIYQFYRIISLTRKATIYKKGSLHIVQHSDETPPFSFFNYCFVNTTTIPEGKMEEILKHEQVHIQKWHSLDILLFELIGVIQWFNPFYWMLRKALIETHEYQADQMVINTHTNVNAYMDTIISFAFSGVALPLGNNFNKSLTLKRLAMMNVTKRTKGALTRLAIALIIAIPGIIIISCSNEKVNDEPVESIVIKSAEATKSQLPNSDDKSVRFVLTKSTDTAQSSEAISDDKIFIIVEDMPKFEGGDINTFRGYIGGQLIYPQTALENGIQGKVFLSFIVEPDGSVSNVTILKGVDPSLDKEAIRAIMSSPKWTPGRQRGQAVKVQFNIPVNFALE